MQHPVSLRTSDPKFAPGWETIASPSLPLALAQTRSPAYTAGYRTPGSYEVAYCLVDEVGSISPPSASVTINPTTNDWDIVGTTPGLPLWVRAGGIYWVWRPVGTTQWNHFAVDGNRNHQWQAMRPFKAICGWQHTFGGHWLYAAGNYSSFTSFPPSSILSKSPPAPVVTLHECPDVALEVAFSWACNQNETALSPILTVAATNGTPIQHAPFTVSRQLAAGNQQPPQGALGMFLYMRKSGTTQWHRQPCLDGHTGYLWPLDLSTFQITRFVESGVQPGPANGKSYLSSLHKALRYWKRDVIVDNDQTICCPLISEFSGPTWDFQPINHFVASFAVGATQNGSFTLTVDGITTPPLPCSFDHAVWNTTWQAAFDAAFGAGAITIGVFGGNDSPKFELTGKYAATDMTGKVSFEVKNGNGNVIVADKVEVAGRGWVMSQADAKFNRTISTSNAGVWYVTDSGTTPDGVTDYPMGWPMWLECSQNTHLIGCKFTMTQSNCGVATCDNSGGQCFHLHLKNVSVNPHFSNTRSVTFGLRCLEFSAAGRYGHSCSELIAENCFFQAKFPIVMEGNQTVNWQIRDCNLYSDGSGDSAILTANTGSSIQFGGRTTADNARCLVASVWCQSVFINEIFVDKGFPCLVSSNANSFTKLTINGGKINQIINFRDRMLAALEYEGLSNQAASPLSDYELESRFLFMNVFESPAGPVESNTMKLVTDNLASQHNSPVRARMVTPKTNAVYKPRVIDEVPSLFQALPP